jgi:AcrR family transcriptional regulator
VAGRIVEGDVIGRVTQPSAAHEKRRGLSQQQADGQGLRERRRLRLMAEIERTAFELFAARGYDAVTVDEIAAACDISQRTFFRHFAAKEDLLFGGPVQMESALLRALAAMSPDMSPLDALHGAILQFNREMASDPEMTALRVQVMRNSQATLTAIVAQRRALHQELTVALAGLMGVDETADMRPALIVSLSLQARWVAVWHWLAAGAQTPVVPVVERALRIAADGLSSAQTEAGAPGEASA